jgi:hypothetical protein
MYCNYKHIYSTTYCTPQPSYTDIIYSKSIAARFDGLAPSGDEIGPEGSDLLGRTGAGTIGIEQNRLFI